ncbi:hypothetical protein GQ56_0111575 [Burkholderia paludis]|uniref:hypothetical protein n=1 Tax=Burkholderia paludis TaxID=1506587 RepID=UPI0004DB86CA|nr:hypothetical protein [Burkholderia paludis]KFG97190.1 hypothetical protein GQ56_0111575 [Burkholderia paludis]
MLAGNLIAARFCIAIASTVMMLAMPVRAEVPPMSDDQLASQADLIATGYVDSVVEHDEVRYPDEESVERSAVDALVDFFRPRPRLVTAIYTVTMEVQQIDKGALPPGERRLQFTARENVQTPKHWMGGTNTLRLSLQSGDTIRVYLERNDDQWVLFHHMGLWLRR